MGGPGGQVSLPASAALRHKFAMNAVYGFLAVSSVMIGAKIARWNGNPNANYVLVHDSSKGELDDVKYIKASELPK
ncbi:hypothetical protein BT67DRAFT_442338 [Trichocladium antarcticum]|uniref:Uncharacterized protein n=1 Tax=Trichocladium antarcticum TaxID=1450529 RepID=A0AAN6ZDI1_9PEZI|nr:hypothetical protein BT67DRAFT_442338 [Trichocladium antarcticum]